MIIKNERKKYASDLTDSQWEMIAPLFPPAGNKSKWEKRELIDAVLYLVDNGCKWRNLPHDFPPHTTVSNFYYAEIKSELWEKLLTALVRNTRERQVAHQSQVTRLLILKASKPQVQRKNAVLMGKKQKVISVIL